MHLHLNDNFTRNIGSTEFFRENPNKNASFFVVSTEGPSNRNTPVITQHTVCRLLFQCIFFSSVSTHDLHFKSTDDVPINQ